MKKKVIRLGLDAATWIAFGLVVTGGAVAVVMWLFRKPEP